MFFVLSGFLITSLMLREKVLTGTISLKTFWKKRARRILPAAATVLLVCAAVAGFFQGDVTVDLGRQVLTGLLFVNNWGQIAASQSYFAGPELFAHFWSLSVEEQFYVLWPLVLVSLLAAVGVRRMGIVVVACTVGAVSSLARMVALYAPGDDPTRVYYGTDTHAFGLLLGAALAAWLIRTRDDERVWQPRPHTGAGRWAATTVELVGLVGFAMLITCLRGDNPAAYQGGLFCASLCMIAMLHGAIKSNPVITTLFTLWPMRKLGAVSYSLYLWHWPVYVFVRSSISDAALAGLVALALSLVLAEVSFRCVEEPFRRKGTSRWDVACSLRTPADPWSELGCS
ncbi:acyltransferase [Corynebacterium qintianiae]|uniref:Acyltransferase n=1 Tax=Corynebacterium qintianiae TaxID=2709392 RepID=A0A7T0KL98_9CORY|nr:acyltransferase [Corynebacterium qintianiae]